MIFRAGFASRHGDDSVREEFRLIDVVGHVDRGVAKRSLTEAKLFAKAKPETGVERGKRLVKEDEARVYRESTRERDAMPLAA